MEILRTYVQDLGGGLVMIGGPESYGAGGYTKIKLELKNVPPSPGEQVAPASPNP